MHTRHHRSKAQGFLALAFTHTDVHPVTPGAKPIVRKPTFPQPAVLPVLSGAVILE